MKQFLTALFIMIWISGWRAMAAPAETDAILMVHFGSTYDEARASSSDPINALVAQEFPDITVREAYTSRIIISRLAKRGIEKPTPREALLQLAAEGYKRVFIQPTNVIGGIELEALHAEVEAFTQFFTEVRIGRQLLYSIDDCTRVTTILADRYADAARGRGAVVLVGHGTPTPATAIYSQMNYMFAATGHPTFFVSTIEGYPTFDTTLDLIRKAKAKNITLVPFMFVAGDHARNDIDVEWRERFESEGFKVETIIEGLGQIPEIRQIYIDHIKAGLDEKPLTAIEHKAAYLKDNL